MLMLLESPGRSLRADFTLVAADLFGTGRSNPLSARAIRMNIRFRAS